MCSSDLIARSDQRDLVGWREAQIDETGDEKHRSRGTEIEEIIEDAAEHAALRPAIERLAIRAPLLEA